MVFLPFYLPNSSLLRRPALGSTALALWIVGQALWLQQGYELEFLGNSTFFPGLWTASAVFFGVNCWILGLIVADIRAPGSVNKLEVGKQSNKKM
jgi:phosphatidylinositol glycan class M